MQYSYGLSQSSIHAPEVGFSDLMHQSMEGGQRVVANKAGKIALSVIITLLQFQWLAGRCRLTE